MTSIEIHLNDIPLTGFMRDTIMTALGYFIINEAFDYEPSQHTIICDDTDELITAFNSALDDYSQKFDKSTGMRIAGNDKKSFIQAYKLWFNTDLPEHYIKFFIDIISKTTEAIKANKIDLTKSSNSFTTSKNGIRIGYVPKDLKAFISPAIIKNMEYYSQGTSFLKPTYGNNAMVDFDLFWFAILSVGMLIEYAGFRGDFYYMLRPDIEGVFSSESLLQSIYDTLDILTELNIENKYSLDAEELFEFYIAFDVAKGYKNDIDKLTNNEIYPIRIFKTGKMGNVFMAKSVYDVNFNRLIDFTSKYVAKIKSLNDTRLYYYPGQKTKQKKSEKNAEEDITEIKDSTLKEGRTPIEQLLDIAQASITSSNSGDNELTSLIMIKDIYRSIMSHNVIVLEQSLYRIIRKYAQYSDSNSKSIKPWLIASLWRFSNIGNIKAILESI